MWTIVCEHVCFVVVMGGSSQRFIPPPRWLGIIIGVCGGSMLIASWENLISADSLGAQGYLGVPPQPPARMALTSSKRVPGMCSELQMSSGEAQATGCSCFGSVMSALGRGWFFCLLFGDSVLPYLQLRTCLFFKHFLQLLQNKVLLFTKMLFKHVVVGLGTSENLGEKLLQDLPSGFFCVYLKDQGMYRKRNLFYLFVSVWVLFLFGSVDLMDYGFQLCEITNDT